MKRTFAIILISCLALSGRAFAEKPEESLQVFWTSIKDDVTARNPQLATDDFNGLIEKLAWLCVGAGDASPYSTFVIALLNDIKSGVGHATVAYYVGDESESRKLIEKISTSIIAPEKRKLTFNSGDSPFVSRPLRLIIEMAIAKIEARSKPGAVK